MLELCRFYNIVIKMIYSDNDRYNKPHFHVHYAEIESKKSVPTLVIFQKIVAELDATLSIKVR